MDAVSKDRLIDLIKEASTVFTLIENWGFVYPEDVQARLMDLPETNCNRYVNIEDVLKVLVNITVTEGARSTCDAIKWIWSKAFESTIKI